MVTAQSELRIADLARTVAGAADLEGLSRPILELLQKLTGLESTYLTVVDESAGQQSILFSSNSGPLRIEEGLTVPWEDTLCRRALLENRRFADDVPTRWSSSTAARQLGLETFLTSPVYDGKGQLFGTLCGASQNQVALPADAQDVMALCTELIAHQVDREILSQEAERRAAQAESQLAELSLLARIGDLCLVERELRPVLLQISDLLVSHAQWTLGAPFVMTADGIKPCDPRDGKWLSLMTQADQSIDRLTPGEVHPDPLLQRDNDTLVRLREEAGLDAAGHSGLVSVECSGRRVAGILLLASEPLSDPVSESRFLVTAANYLSLLSERASYLTEVEAANAELAHFAMTDPLTGIANRRQLVDQLRRLLAAGLRNGTRVLVAFIDLDGFKRINDEHGHEMGDAFLQQMATRLTDMARASDLVARYGGDEFVLVSPAAPADTPEQCRSGLIRRLESVTSGRFELPDLTLDYEGPSIGAILSEPGEQDVDQLLSRADAAMYRVKQARKTRA